MPVRTFLFAVCCVGTGGIAGGQVITEFPIPCLPPCEVMVGRPVGITTGPDGNLWFTESGAIFREAAYLSAIGKITTEGVIAQFQAAGGPALSANTLGDIAAGPDENLWFTEVDHNQIGRITTGGVLSEFTIPTPNSGPQGIAAGSDGSLWFTERYANQIGRITTSGAVTEFPIPTAGSGPGGITTGPDGNLWFTEVNANRIGRISTSGAVSDFPIPTISSDPEKIAAGPDGNLWFTEQLGNKIGRVTTSGAIVEFPISTGIGTVPYGIAAGPDGNLWFTEGSANQIGRITTSGVISEFPIPTASSAPQGIAAGPDGNIWFTEYTGTIGRITTSETPTCNADAHTLCLNGNRFSVTASFQATPEGPSSPATAVPLTNDTGYFWFFDPANIELVVKVLTGCSVNNEYWVFAGGLTDVGVEMKVTDTQMGAVKMYSNAVGTPFQPIQDSSAFPCP